MQSLLYVRNGGQPKYRPAMPEGLTSRLLVYNWYARNMGWTPREVDELSLDEMEWLPLIGEAFQEAASRELW